MYKKIIFIISLISFINLNFTGCKKSSSDTSDNAQENEQSIPGFYNINFKTIFSKNDNYSPDDTKINNQLNDYFTHIWEAQKLSGGILIARGNNILFEKYSGYANIDAQTPITSTTSMHVASVSKILTSLAILKLVEANELELDQTVKSILPHFPYPDITIQDLLTHRSGLSNYAHLADETKSWDKSKRMNNQDVLNLYSTYKPALKSKRNTHFSYSNTNFALLALIVEKITHKTFPEAINIMIFKPLSMNHSYIFQEKDLPNATLSYYAKGKPYEFDHLDLIYGDKNLYTTPEDLFRLSQAMYASNFLQKDLLEQMFTPYSNEKSGIKNYGLGMRMMIFNNGKKITYHTGWWHGSNAIFIHLIDEKVTIIAIGNKFSRTVYSALRLTSLFGDYPLHMEEPDHNENESVTTLFNKVILNKKTDKNKNRNSLNKDTVQANTKKKIIKESKNISDKKN